MGSTPATSYQSSRTVCLNLDLYFNYPRQIRHLIALHEEGHIALNTDSEIEADNYAFRKISGTFPGSHSWAILSVSRVLPFINKDQYIRLLNMYKNALIAETYERNGPLPYEASYIDKELQRARSLSEKEYAEMNTVDPVTGDTSPIPPHVAPVGPFVQIARETWMKKKLGDPLTGYDLTILDKYPMPEDFEAYQVKRDDVLSTITDIAPSTTSPATTSSADMAVPAITTTVKSNFWWYAAAALVLILIISDK